MELLYKPDFARAVRFLDPAMRLAWHLLGQPNGWGLVSHKPVFVATRRKPYTWFRVGQPDLSAAWEDPQAMLATGVRCLVKDAPTKYVAAGTCAGLPVFFKRYNYRGVRDAARNLLWPSRARHSFTVAQQVASFGFATPQALLACERRAGWWLRESYLVMRVVPAMDLDQYVAVMGYTDELIRQTARLVRRLHDRGVLQMDLKGRNLMRGDDGTLYLIDLDRCRIQRFVSMRGRAKNLSYLNASFAAAIPQEKRCLFLAEYVQGERYLEHRQAWLARQILRFSAQRGAPHLLGHEGPPRPRPAPKAEGVPALDRAP